MSKSYLISIQINNYIMLSNKCTSHHYLIWIMSFSSNTVAFHRFSIQILTRIPNKIKGLLGLNSKFKYREWNKIFVGPIWELILVIAKANFVVLAKFAQTITLATEQFKVIVQHSVKVNRQVRECCAWVNEASLVACGSKHQMIVHTNSIQSNLEKTRLL